ncbi:SHOCT domain-containing protein [Streptomyces sp. NPDC060031]|uniref:SHOCT domain-containing protein n=1 Tax=Streptomyces sp. NPDC060031 TaxID=3347043 RepID=UPI0036A5380D
MFIRPVRVTVRSADRPAGSPLLRGLLARAAGAAEGTVRADAPRRGVRWIPAGAVEPAEPEPGEPEPAAPWEPEPGEPEPREPEPVEPEPVEPPEAGPAEPPRGGLAVELRQLADLAREGLLTPEEFTTAKARLLHP